MVFECHKNMPVLNTRGGGLIPKGPEEIILRALLASVKSSIWKVRNLWVFRVLAFIEREHVGLGLHELKNYIHWSRGGREVEKKGLDSCFTELTERTDGRGQES